MTEQFEIYKGFNRKAYAIFKDLSIPKKEMIKIANRNHFHGLLEDLECVSGYITKNEELFLSSRFVPNTQTVWVVLKK